MLNNTVVPLSNENMLKYLAHYNVSQKNIDSANIYKNGDTFIPGTENKGLMLIKQNDVSDKYYLIYFDSNDRTVYYTLLTYVDKTSQQQEQK